MPGAKQAWPISAACWSPAMPRIGIAAPNSCGAVAHVGKHRPRHAERGAEFIAPGVGVDIVERRARRVGGVGGVHGSCRQPPQQKRIYGAEGKLTALRSLACARYVVKEPSDLRGGKVGV